MSDTEYKVGYGKPPRHSRFKKGEPSANPRGRPRKNLAALLVDGLNKPVTVTENGRRRNGTVREAAVSQLINKSATADLRATKMLLDIMRDAEKQAGAPSPPRGDSPFHTGRRGGSSLSSSSGCATRSGPNGLPKHRLKLGFTTEAQRTRRTPYLNLDM